MCVFETFISFHIYRARHVACPCQKIKRLILIKSNAIDTNYSTNILQTADMAYSDLAF